MRRLIILIIMATSLSFQGCSTIKGLFGKKKEKSDVNLAEVENLRRDYQDGQVQALQELISMYNDSNLPFDVRIAAGDVLAQTQHPTAMNAIAQVVSEAKALDLSFMIASIELLAEFRNNPKAGVLAYVNAEGIPIFIHNKTRFPSNAEYTDSLFNELKKANTDLLVLAGFMKKIPDEIVTYFKRRILNIHPSLLPKFSGKGFFGMNVHRAVIEMKEKESGASVHFVNKIYDDGPIVAQSIIKVKGDDSPEDLAARVLIEEHKLYFEVVKPFQRLFDPAVCAVRRRTMYAGTG